RRTLGRAEELPAAARSGGLRSPPALGRRPAAQRQRADRVPAGARPAGRRAGEAEAGGEGQVAPEPVSPIRPRQSFGRNPRRRAPHLPKPLLSHRTPDRRERRGFQKTNQNSLPPLPGREGVRWERRVGEVRGLSGAETLGVSRPIGSALQPPLLLRNARRLDAVRGAEL